MKLDIFINRYWINNSNKNTSGCKHLSHSSLQINENKWLSLKKKHLLPLYIIWRSAVTPLSLLSAGIPPPPNARPPWLRSHWYQKPHLHGCWCRMFYLYRCLCPHVNPSFLFLQDSRICEAVEQCVRSLQSSATRASDTLQQWPHASSPAKMNLEVNQTSLRWKHKTSDFSMMLHVIYKIYFKLRLYGFFLFKERGDYNYK